MTTSARSTHLWRQSSQRAWARVGGCRHTFVPMMRAHSRALCCRLRPPPVVSAAMEAALAPLLAFVRDSPALAPLLASAGLVGASPQVLAAALFGVALATLLVARVLLGVLFRDKSLPPFYTSGVAGLPVLGGFITFLKARHARSTLAPRRRCSRARTAQGPLPMMADAFKRHGQVFTVSLFHRRVTFLLGPEVSAHFYKARRHAWRQPRRVPTRARPSRRSARGPPGERSSQGAHSRALSAAAAARTPAAAHRAPAHALPAAVCAASQLGRRSRRAFPPPMRPLGARALRRPSRAPLAPPPAPDAAPRPAHRRRTCR